MLDWLLLTTRVFPLYPLLACCSVMSPVVFACLTPFCVGWRLAPFLWSLGPSVARLPRPWRVLTVSACGPIIDSLLNPVVVLSRPFQFFRFLPSLSLSCIVVMSLFIVMLYARCGSLFNSTAVYYTEELVHAVFPLLMLPYPLAPFKCYLMLVTEKPFVCFMAFLMLS